METSNPDDIFNPEEDTKTAFNSSLDIIQRISRLRYSAHASYLADNLMEFFHLLILIHTEIDFKLNDEQRKELEEYEEDLKDKLKKAIKTFRNSSGTWIQHPELREGVKEDLLELQKVLLRLAYKVGLGMMDMNDPRQALMNG